MGGFFHKSGPVIYPVITTHTTTSVFTVGSRNLSRTISGGNCKRLRFDNNSNCQTTHTNTRTHTFIDIYGKFHGCTKIGNFKKPKAGHRRYTFFSPIYQIQKNTLYHFQPSLTVSVPQLRAIFRYTISIHTRIICTLVRVCV